MKDITIIIPVHQIDDRFDEYVNKAIESVAENTKTFSEGKLITMVVCPETIERDLTDRLKKLSEKYSYEYIALVVNKGESDFCSQINCGVQNCSTDYFSILEYDDEYSKNWFKMAHDYYFSNEDVSVFLPINAQHSEDRTKWQFGNEIVWASSFSNEIGFIDFDCLQNCSTFNLTGGIFNKEDFISIGMLKPSIKVAFNYEFLLRATHNKLKVYVVPKEGYTHVIGRKNSLTDEYSSTLSDEEIQKWFELAMREYPYKEDRKKNIIVDNTENVK